MVMEVGENFSFAAKAKVDRENAKVGNGRMLRH